VAQRSVTSHSLRAGVLTAALILSAGCADLFGPNEDHALRVRLLEEVTAAEFFESGDSIGAWIAPRSGVLISVPVEVRNVSSKPQTITSCRYFYLLRDNGEPAVQDRCAAALWVGRVVEPGEAWVTTAEVRACFGDVDVLADPECFERWSAENIAGVYRWGFAYQRAESYDDKVVWTKSPAFTVVDQRLWAVGRTPSP
jgi:hypothetical protein